MQAENAKHAAEMLKRSGELAGTANVPAGRLFANCSKLPQRIATIIWHNRGALRENGTDIPHNLRKALPANAHAGTFPCGCSRSSGAQQAHKKLSPVSMRGNSQNGGQTTKSLLIKPQCSGVPNTAGSVAFLLLSTTLPAFCLCIYIDKTKIPERLRTLRYFILHARFLLPGGKFLLPLFFQDGGGALHGGCGAAQFLVSKFGAHPAVAALQKLLLLRH